MVEVRGEQHQNGARPAVAEAAHRAGPPEARVRRQLEGRARGEQLEPVVAPRNLSGTSFGKATRGWGGRYPIAQ